MVRSQHRSTPLPIPSHPPTRIATIELVENAVTIYYFTLFYTNETSLRESFFPWATQVVFRHIEHSFPILFFLVIVVEFGFLMVWFVFTRCIHFLSWWKSLSLILSLDFLTVYYYIEYCVSSSTAIGACVCVSTLLFLHSGVKGQQ